MEENIPWETHQAKSKYQVFKSNEKIYLSKEISLKESRWLAIVTRHLKIVQKIPQIAEIKRRNRWFG